MANKIKAFIYNLILCSHSNLQYKEKYDQVMMAFRSSDTRVQVCEYIYERALAKCREIGFDTNSIGLTENCSLGENYALLQELAKILTQGFCLEVACQYLAPNAEMNQPVFR